jgi:glycosyltransferase involved in cell wall biosynthesis
MNMLIQGLIKHGWDVYYVSNEAQNARNEKLHQYISTKRRFWLHLLKTILSLRKMKLDICLCIHPVFLILCSLILKRAHSKVYFARGDFELEMQIKHPILGKKCGAALLRLALTQADNVLCVNEDLKRKIASHCRRVGNIVVIPNAIRRTERKKQSFDVHNVLNLPPDSKIICYFGGQHPIKGGKYLLNAFKPIPKEFQNVYLLYGGPSKGFQNTDFPNNHTIPIGTSMPVQDVLNAADILVVPSLYEGSPNIILEAFDTNTLILGSSVGGIADMLKYPDSLFAPGDIESLRKTLTRTLSYSKKQQKIMHQKLRDRQKAYSFFWEAKIDQLLREIAK